MTLRDELVEREAGDIAEILDGDNVDQRLLAMWEKTLREADPLRIIGTAILWCSRKVIANAASQCVRLVTTHPLLDAVEAWSRGELPLDAIWERTFDFRVRNAREEMVLEVANAAGDNTQGFDDEALASAGKALTAASQAVETAKVVEVLRTLLPVPTVAAFRAAYTARNSS